MNLPALKAHFAGWRGWELNPIVIKELRQAVRNRAVTGMLMLFLVVLLGTSLVVLLSLNSREEESMEIGSSMFSSFLVILAGASTLFIPLHIGVRVALERPENDPDLLYVTTLSPFRIVLGKFLCGAYLAVLFFSACMPFMAFTNLMRGVDLPTIFLILGFLFLMVCTCNMAAIFLACLMVSRAFKYLVLIAGLFLSAIVVSWGIAMSYSMMNSGIGSMLSLEDAWLTVAIDAGVGLGLIGLLFTLTVGLISPPSSNRALPIRAYVSVIWLLGGVVTVLWPGTPGTAGWLDAWSISTLVSILGSLLVTVSNSDHLSLRVRRTIPKSRTRRVFAFLFYNGAAGGLVWSALIVGTTLLVCTSVWSSRTGSTGPTDPNTIIAVAAYAFSYALTGLFLQRTFLPSRPPKLAAVLTVALMCCLALVPGIVLFFMNRLTWKVVEGLQLGNVFNLGMVPSGADVTSHLRFSMAWLGVVALLNVRWFLRQARAFRPPARPPPLTPPPEEVQSSPT